MQDDSTCLFLDMNTKAFENNGNIWEYNAYAYPPTPAICRGSAPEKKLFQDSGRFPRAFLVASESNVRH